MFSLNDKIKQALAEKRMRGRISPSWPSGYPKSIEVLPQPLEGYIEHRIIYRRVFNTTVKEKQAEFYVSRHAAYFYLDSDSKQYNWNVLSYDEYTKEYKNIFDNLKSHGVVRTAFKSAEIEILDEVVQTVPFKLIMELMPSPEEIDQIQAGTDALLEDKYLNPSKGEQDLLDSVD